LKSHDNIAIFDKIKIEDKVSNLEVMIQGKEEKIATYLLSSVKGSYQENNVILISLFDITVQKQAEETLRKLAIKDELTGLYNRHFLEAMIDEQMERSIRYNYPISIAILDLDYFKRINDNWGHPVGDMILKITADITSNNIRKSDFLIRLGGEEFLLIFPHTNLKVAVMIAEKIRKEIEAYTNPVVGKYTVSLGVTQRINTESFHTMYERADAAMYRAKNEGRNRVVSFESQADMPIAAVYLEWKVGWNSGNEYVDEQHKELLNYANSLMYLSLSNKDKEKAKQIVELLEKKIVQHFKYEEKVLRQISFPDYEEHVKIHQDLVDKFEALKASFLKGEMKPSLFFMFIVDDVVVEHLLEIDTKFFPYIKGDI
jgi:diguanylate cyclase (GGDEF)-like protein/hemerythrin-like metal-binding protein